MKIFPDILITNDDGVHAPGLTHLWHSLKDLADLTVIAPAEEQSAVALSITIRRPLRIKNAPWNGEEGKAYSVSGTPADCVKMAISVILEKRPDFIMSGINRGSNAGRNILYSGTVAAVIEGVFRGIPGVAFSCVDYWDIDYKRVEDYIPLILNHVIEHPLPQGTFLNVNFPVSSKNIMGMKMARQGQQYWAEDPDKRSHPTEKHTYYWMGAKMMKFEEHEESDIAWLDKGYITAVPVHVGELTDHVQLEKRKSHFEALYLRRTDRGFRTAS